VVAPAFVQSTTGSSSGVTNPVVSTAFSSALSAGNLVVVTVADDSGTTTGVTNVTDSLGNAYTQILATHGTASIQMWYAVLSLGGAGVTVNVSWNTGITAGVTLVAQEFSGINPLHPLDLSAFSAATTSVNVTSAATAPSSLPKALVVAGGVHSGATAAWTLGTGYTNLGSVDVTNRSVAQESKVISNIAAQTGSFTIASSLENIGTVAIFNAKNVGGAFRHFGTGDGASSSEAAN
jgi:hypothetical protein